MARRIARAPQRRTREAHERITKRFRVGSRVVMGEDALDNYGERWQGVVFVVTSVSTAYMPSGEFFSKGRPTGYHPGFDPAGGSALYNLAVEDTGKELGNSLYDWELEPAPGAMKRRGRGATREAPRNVPADETAARELVMYIENESDLSPDGPRGQGRDVLLNALRKYRKGTYDPTLAIKLFGYLVESGAKKYTKESGTNLPWHEMFNTATRREAARQLEASFRNSAEQGEYDRVDVRTGAREMDAARKGPWDGSDTNERAYNTVHNGLVNIVIDGPNERSPEMLKKAKQVLSDLNRQTPPKREQVRHDVRVNRLRQLIFNAEEVVSGRRDPQKSRSLRESSRDRDRPISMTYGVLPPFEQFERDIRRPDPDRPGKPYWPAGTLYPMELVDPHEIDMAEDYGLDAFEAERRSTGRNSRVRGFRGDERQIWGFLEYLSSFGEEDPAAMDLASSIMTTLGYEWI